jgi:hypothetical protein
MIWLLIFVVIIGYIIATHKEIILYFKMLKEKFEND